MKEYTYTLEEQKQHRNKAIKALRGHGYSTPVIAGKFNSQGYTIGGVLWEVKGESRDCQDSRGFNNFTEKLEDGCQDFYGFQTSQGKYLDFGRVKYFLLQSDLGFHTLANIIELEPEGLFVTEEPLPVINWTGMENGVLLRKLGHTWGDNESTTEYIVELIPIDNLDGDKYWIRSTKIEIRPCDSLKTALYRGSQVGKFSSFQRYRHKVGDKDLGAA